MTRATPFTTVRLAWMLIGWATVLTHLNAIAQSSPNPPPLRFSVRTWQTDEGLPQNSVHALAQTPDGFLWVGTREGLVRFDGVRFTPLDDASPAEARQGWITALCATRDGSLWIGCEGHGLIRRHAGQFTRYSEMQGLPSIQVRCLLETSDGTLWIGSEGGLTRFDQGRFTRFTTAEGLTDNSVRALTELSDGTLVIATVGGWSTLTTNGTLRTERITLPATIGALKTVHADPDNTLWLGAIDGLTRLQEGRRTRFGVLQGLPDNVISALYRDHRGQLWVGTFGGLARVVDDRIHSEPTAGAAFSDLINVLFEDRERNLWAGGRDGLYRLNPTRIVSYGTEQGLSHNNVVSVCEDRAGAVWLGTWRGGVNRLAEGLVTVIRSTNGLTHDSVLSLHEGRDGRMWVGLDFGGGLNRLNHEWRNDFPRRTDLLNAAVRVIHEDPGGALWVGTSRGLNVIRSGQVETYTTEQGLAGNLVMALAPNGEGTMWIGTDGGLSFWDGAKFRNYGRRDGLSDNSVNAIHRDAEGTLWLGTREGGLNRFRGGKFTAYTTREGLHSDEIYEILEDDFGYFWMSCRRGIFRVSRADLDAVGRGQARWVNSTVFGRVDGLASVQCNGVAKPAAWKGRDGRLWFATIRGVAAIESRLEINPLPPPVLIESVLADRRPLPRPDPESEPARGLVIPPGRGELEIRYTALSFQAPEKMRFKYRLEGWDADWVDGGPERVARYNSVRPGAYHFRVIASNNDGIWNETGARLAFVLQPHYWETWWFKLLLAGSVLSVLALIYQRRLARLREIEQLRVRIAADLHDDIGARLTKVAMVTEQLERETDPSDRARPHVQNIARTTREIIRAMDETVWTINPQNDTVDNLANYLFHYCQEYFQNTGIRCRFDLPTVLPDHSLPTEARHHLFMAVKEALNNALKHSGATEVKISLALVDRGFTLTIADNGRGFDPGFARGVGHGLTTMTERLHQMGGQLELHSQPGQGTMITMKFRAR